MAYVYVTVCVDSPIDSFIKCRSITCSLVVFSIQYISSIADGMTDNQTASEPASRGLLAQMIVILHMNITVR